jgi:diguanylate cyclase
MTGDVLEPADAAVIEAVIGLARALGLRPVAEGVETDAQWAELKCLGCEFAQGYFISRPLPADALVAWLGDSQFAAPRIAPQAAENARG